jgi:ABC-type enterochelin transport system permease subunit
VQAKEGGNVELKIIVTHILGDGVRSITEWMKLLMGPHKAFFLQVQPNFISHLKLVWHPVLIMVLLVLGIGLL